MTNHAKTFNRHNIGFKQKVVREIEEATQGEKGWGNQIEKLFQIDVKFR